MTRLLADEDFHGAVVRSLRERLPPGTLMTVQELGRSGRTDSDLVRFAAESGFVLISHDHDTLIGTVYEWMATGERCPGVIVVPQRWRTTMGEILADIELLLACEDELENQVRHLPLT